ICVMPWEFYLRYGDKSVLESSFEGMKAYTTKFFGNWIREDGTVLVEKATPDGPQTRWFSLGDWVPPFGLPETSLVHTFYYWLCARNTCLAAKALGKDAEAENYHKLSESIKEAFDKAYYNPEEKSYGDSGSNVFALYMGVPEDHYADVCATLRNELAVKYKGHVNTGFVATRFLFETLATNGMADLAYTIMDQRDFPSYGWWIEQGATTTWEEWNGDGSRNHPMFGGGLTWLSKNLAGMDTDPQAPGFKHIIIRPIPVKELPEVRYSTQTPYGVAESRVSHDGNAVKVEVTVPFGSTATVYVPKSVGAASANPQSDDSYTVMEVGPGHHCLP
ncbi:MAG: hypothetical protein IJ840_07960, partial [Bacteroidales bacterium]|nr:hypothetical protein [Bacteroidales bacterium]